jgi:hypothetical protein
MKLAERIFADRLNSAGGLEAVEDEKEIIRHADEAIRQAYLFASRGIRPASPHAKLLKDGGS